MRAINADALIEFIENRYDITWKDDYEGGIKDACVDILEEINKMPTIEPERKTGHWVGIDDEPCDDWECDRCGEVVTDCGYDVLPNFCPNCGADMRGEQE